MPVTMYTVCMQMTPRRHNQLTHCCVITKVTLSNLRERGIACKEGLKEKTHTEDRHDDAGDDDTSHDRWQGEMRWDAKQNGG